MLGIQSVGVYVPYFRLSRDLIAKAWGRGSFKGERSVANNDEDCITMSVEAALNCLNETNQHEVDGLFFASTSAPYKEKSCAGLVATVCDLGSQIITADFANSLRASTAALRTALDTVKASSAKKILVTAADCRLGYPGSDQEQLFGDGAAALMIGDRDVIAELEAYCAINYEIMDVWRNDNDIFVRTGENRFIVSEGYNVCMQQVVSGVLKQAGLKPGEIKKIILSSPDLRSSLSVARGLGFDITSQLQDALMLQVGNCGTAQPLMLLVAALEEADPGDRLLLAAYGDGADAFIFRVTDQIRKMKGTNGIKRFLDKKMMLPSYERYLSYRGVLEVVPGEPFRLFPSNAAYWRDQKSILRFYGSRCKKCGASAFPIQRVCYACGSLDEYEEIRFGRKKGKLFTYSIDYLAGRSDDPVVVHSVVEDDQGTRFYLMMTDFDQAELKVGLEVEFTFRKIYEGANFNNYFWKCRPVRNGGGVL